MSRSQPSESTGPTGPAGPPPRRGPSRTAVAAALLALVSGAWLMHLGTETHAPPAPSPSDALLGAGHHGGAPDSSAAAHRPVPVTPLPASVPVRVRIPSIRVNAPVMKLGVDGRNQIQVPPDGNRNMAGWYEYGVTPGEAGTSVLLGHVDTLKGPAVFYDLGALHKGNTIEVTRQDHRVAVFTVYGIEVYAKADFPTDKVYGDAPGAQLRVITCGGGFSKATHSYLGNVVVYARLSATRDAPTAAVPSGSATAAPAAAGRPSGRPAPSGSAHARPAPGRSAPGKPAAAGPVPGRSGRPPAAPRSAAPVSGTTASAPPTARAAAKAG